MAGMLAMVVGLLLIGAGAGHLLAPAKQVRTVTEVPAEAAGTSAPAVMPDILGLTEQVARRVLYDAKITSRISTTTAPAAGPAGRVLEQSPDPGSEVSGVTLTLSSPTTVPQVVGLDVDAAQARLQKLGAAVLIRQVVAPAAAVHSVLKTDPPAGAALPISITLSVAYPGDALALTDLYPVDNSACGTGTSATVSGKQLDASLTCNPGNDSPATTTYVIGRHAQLLQATLGLDDSGGTGGATVRIEADGRLLGSYTLRYGIAEPIQLPVTAVLRLVLTTATTSVENPPTVVFGNISLLGTAGELDNLRR